MQHLYSDSPDSRQGYEQSQEGHLVFEDKGRIDAGEKILPLMRERRHIHRLGLRLIIALVSLLVLILASAFIGLNDTGQFPDLTNLNLVFVFFTIGSINVIANLLLDRAPGRPTRKGIVGRLIFAIVTGSLTPVFIWAMIGGDNGANGVLLVLIVTISANIISYLTLCEKRRPASKD